MLLDQNGGPNWAKNWCIAPVIVNTEDDEVYFTPLYYTLAHFSKFIRPGAVRIGIQNPNEKINLTAAKNPDGSIAVVLFNPEDEAQTIQLTLESKTVDFTLTSKAIQTLVFYPLLNNQMPN